MSCVTLSFEPMTFRS